MYPLRALLEVMKIIRQVLKYSNSAELLMVSDWLCANDLGPQAEVLKGEYCYIL